MSLQKSGHNIHTLKTAGGIAFVGIMGHRYKMKKLHQGFSGLPDHLPQIQFLHASGQINLFFPWVPCDHADPCCPSNPGCLPWSRVNPSTGVRWHGV
jgi:hypothetical protein